MDLTLIQSNHCHIKIFHPTFTCPYRVQKQVRWTEAEWAEVQRAAAEAGQTPSEFIRRAVLARCREG